MGFEKLIDLLVQFMEFFKCCAVVDAYERGVHLRFGTPLRNLEPGLRFHIPFFVDRFLCDNVVTRTGTIGVQSLLTKDNRPITLKAVVTSNIFDIRAALLEVESVDHALIDSCAGAIGAYVADHTWEEIASPETSNELAKVCRRNAKRFGIEIERVQLVDLTPARALRLMQESSLRQTQ